MPSVTVLRADGAGSAITQAFEERLLFLLLLLRQAALRMVYVTSTPINPRIIEYYLALLPGVIPSHALARLTLISTDDSSDRPLSQKLLERPRLLDRIAAHIPNRSRSHLIPYNTTSLERDLALALGIPMYGADPLGAEDLYSLDEVTDAIGDMLSVRPSISQVIIKTNEGVSGTGNALIDLAWVLELPDGEQRSAIAMPGCGPCSWNRPRWRWMRTSPSSSATVGSSRSGSSVRSWSAPVSSSGPARTAVSNCCRPMTSFSVVRVGRAISAACSPPTRPTRD